MISRSSGTLDARHETHKITLDCSTECLDIYSTYVVVEVRIQTHTHTRTHARTRAHAPTHTPSSEDPYP